MSTTTAAPPAPIIPRPNDLYIPEPLEQRRQWVCWRWEWDERNEKWTKVPINAKTGNRASTTDPTTWATFEQAFLRAEKSKGALGLGFVFSANDDIAGVDLDTCRDPETGEFAPWAAAILNTFDTYAEISISETGVHIYGNAHVGAGHNKVYETGKVEVYDRGRFFVVTGNKLPG